MAVGVVYAGYLAGDGQISAAAAGPLPGHCHSEFSGGRHYFYAPSGGGDESVQGFHSGILSGVVEPVGALLTILAATLLVPALPYLLSFAAGAMLYVVVEELIPEMSHGTHSNVGTLFLPWAFPS